MWPSYWRDIFHYYLISTTCARNGARASSRCHCNLHLISWFLNSLGKVLDAISGDYPLILCLVFFHHTAGPCDPIALESPCQAARKSECLITDSIVFCAQHILKDEIGASLVCSELPDDDNRGGKGSVGGIHYYSRFTAKTKHMTHPWPWLYYSLIMKPDGQRYKS